MTRREFILKWGIMTFAPLLLIGGTLRYLYAHDFNIEALASLEFISLFVGALVFGVPIAGYVWGSVMWWFGFGQNTDLEDGHQR